MKPGLVLVFDPPVGPEPTRCLVTNASMNLRATVCDVDGCEITLAPGETKEAVLVLGRIAGVKP